MTPQAPIVRLTILMTPLAAQFGHELAVQYVNQHCIDAPEEIIIQAYRSILLQGAYQFGRALLTGENLVE